MSKVSGLSLLRTPRVLDLTHNPVGLWWFDGDLVDKTGNDDFGVVTGTLQYASSHEHGRLAVRFRDNVLRIGGSSPAPSILRVQGDVTVQAVLMLDTLIEGDTDGTDFFGCYGAAGNSLTTHDDLYGLSTAAFDTTTIIPLFFWRAAGNSYQVVKDDDFHLSLGQWYHVVGVRESEGGGTSTGRLYVNGALIAEETGLTDPTDGSLTQVRSGQDVAGGVQGWRGGILSSAKVVPRALSAREVLGEYQYVAGERGNPVIQ
jgi:hypothetical protein